MVGEAPAQQLDQRPNRARAFVAQSLPLRLGCRGNADLDLVKLRAADRRLDLAGSDVKVDHRSVADVSPATRQAVRVVHVGLQVVAPRLAPEGAGNRAALDLDGPDGLSLLSQQIGR